MIGSTSIIYYFILYDTSSFSFQFSNFSFWYTCVLGVSVLAIGIAHADIEELRKIASPTTYKNIFFASDFDDLPSIEREFISSICSEALLSEFKQHDEVGHADQSGIMGHFFTIHTAQVKIVYVFVVVCSTGHTYR